MRHLPVGRVTRENATFEVIDPATNGNRGAVGLSMKAGYHREVVVAAGDRRAASLYLLHAMSGSGNPLGWMIVEYADGAHVTQYIHPNKEIETWFMPAPNTMDGWRKSGPERRVWWQGPNGKFENVGVHAYGWNNPHPDKPIRRIRMVKAETGGLWYLLGVSLSDQPVYFPESPVSYGIPDSWGASAMVYALLEGLAGVVDTGVAFDRARISPRWQSAKTRRARVAVTYPASGGYAAYDYKESDGGLKLQIAGTAQETVCELLLPEGVEVESVRVDGQEPKWDLVNVGDSRYLRTICQGLNVHEVEVSWKGVTAG